MSRDILFKIEDKIFSYRVGGILVENGKILLQRDKWGNHAVIGGHVSFMEQAKDTLVREFMEELQVKIGVDELLAVNENFFMWGDKPCHQVHFYYAVHLEDDTFFREGEISGVDELEDLRVELDFVWVPLEELKNISVYPRGIERLLEKNNGVIHFVYNELE